MAHPLWSTINLNRFPGEIAVNKALAKKSMADQARAAGYQDLYRNIQAMRDAAFQRETARGEFVKEFSGIDLPVIGSIDLKSVILGGVLVFVGLKLAAKR